VSGVVARSIMRARPVLEERGHIAVYDRVDRRNRLLMGGRSPMHWIKRPRHLLSHLPCWAALTAACRRQLVPWLERPPCDHR
jgi:hypothetical protein